MKNTILFLLLPLISFGQFDFNEVIAPDDFSLSAIRKSPIGEYFIQATNDLDHIYSSFNGTDWTKSSLPSKARLESVIFLSNGTPVIASSYSNGEHIIRRNDNWYQIPLIDGNAIFDPMVFFAKNDTLFAYQDQTFIYSSDDGASFTTIFETTIPLVASSLVKLDGYYVLHHSEGSNSSFSVFNEGGLRVLFDGLEITIDRMVSGECNEIIFYSEVSYVLVKMDGLTVEEGSLADIDINFIYGRGTIIFHEGSYYYNTHSLIYKSSGCDFNWELLTENEDLELDIYIWPYEDADVSVTPEEDILFNTDRKNFYWKWNNTDDSWTKEHINISYPDVIEISESLNNEQFAMTNNFLSTKTNNISIWHELNDEYYFPYTGADYAPSGILYFIRLNELNYSNDNGITYTNIPLPDFIPFEEGDYQVKILAENFIYLRGSESFYSPDNGENWFPINYSDNVKLIDDYILLANYRASFLKLNLETQTSTTNGLNGLFHSTGSITRTIASDGTIYIYFIEGVLPSSEGGLYKYEFDGVLEYLGAYPELEDHELEVLPDGKILAMSENGYHILEEDILTSYSYDGIPTDIYGEKQFFLSKNYHLFVVEGGHRIFRSSEPFFDLPVNTTPLVKEEDFAFFPNPANEILNIELEESMNFIINLDKQFLN